LVVLVNGGSGSASEIVTGALQDLDRAVIVGEPTFGKGLVQKVFNIDKINDVKLKITTARYYIPSGRCIQKRDYAAHNDVIVADSSDSVRHARVFRTKNGRPVHDRGGIEPDVPVKGDSLSAVAVTLIRKNLLFDFAVRYHQKHPEWNDSTFTLTPSIKKDFLQYLKDKKFHFEIEGERVLANLKKLVKEHRYDSGILNLIDQLQAKLEANKDLEFKRNEGQIFELLRLELAEKYFGSTMRAKLALEDDPQAAKALEILHDLKSYRSILAGPAKGKNVGAK
jgi:carboxyl-terminal processing protease